MQTNINKPLYSGCVRVTYRGTNKKIVQYDYSGKPEWYQSMNDFCLWCIRESIRKFSIQYDEIDKESITFHLTYETVYLN